MIDATQHEPTPGDLVADKYRLTRLVGRGGMGSVWEGQHVSLGTCVAVKFIDASYADSTEARSRFENEARAAAKLQSKHVVQVFDHGVTPDGRPYIVMEFLSGEPLDKRLDRLGRLAPLDTVRITGQVCRALTRAHAAGIVHRDLKPENIFLVWDDEDQADTAKVVDFGIAKFTDGQLGVSSSTRTGSVLGTPYFMSPEQARGLRSVDHRSDLWSMGVLAFRCLVGRLPFEGEAVGDLLVKICTAPIPVPSEIAPDLPSGFDAWFERAVRREPSERFSNAQELADQLALACGFGRPMAKSSSLVETDSSQHTAEDGRSAPGGISRSLAQAGTVEPRVRTDAQGLTASPLTHTPAPRLASNRRAVFGIVIAAVAVLGIGVGVALKWMGESRGAGPLSHAPADTPSSISTMAASKDARKSPPHSVAAVASTPTSAMGAEPEVLPAAASASVPHPAVEAPRSASKSPAPVRRAPSTPRTKPGSSPTTPTPSKPRTAPTFDIGY